MKYRTLPVSCIPILLLLLAGCATAVKQLPGEYYIGMMPEESSYLLKIDVRNNRSLTELLLQPSLNGEALPSQLVDRISNAYMAVQPASSSASSPFAAPVISLTATGQFPTGIISTNLDRENEWEKRSNHITYWYNKKLLLELALPERNLLCLSTKNVGAMVDRYNKRKTMRIPEEVRREFDISDVVVYIPDPGADMLAQGGGAGAVGFNADLPIDAVWITLFSPVEDTKRSETAQNSNHAELSYDVALVFKVADPSKTKQLTLISRLFIVAWMKQADIGDISTLREKISITAGGDHVRIEGLELTVAEIAKGIGSLPFGPAVPESSRPEDPQHVSLSNER